MDTDPDFELTLSSWELRSPAELIRRVARRVPLVEGSVYAVLVADPSTRQRIVRLERVDGRDPRDVVDDLRRRWGSPAGILLDHEVVTVVVRRGLTVFSGVELEWRKAWRYGLVSALPGRQAILVTEHGWCDAFTDHADHQPALVVS